MTHREDGTLFRPGRRPWRLAGCLLLVSWLAVACTPTPTGQSAPSPTPLVSYEPAPTVTPAVSPALAATAPRLPQGAQALHQTTVDFDGDTQPEAVVLAAFGASPGRLSADHLEMFVFAPAAAGHTLVWQSQALAGERGEPLVVKDINIDGRLEVLSVQAAGAAGEMLYILGWQDGRYGFLAPHGGRFDGGLAFGEVGASVVDAADGSAEVHAAYGPAASRVDVYKWDGTAYTYQRTVDTTQ